MNFEIAARGFETSTGWNPAVFRDAEAGTVPVMLGSPAPLATNVFSTVGLPKERDLPGHQGTAVSPDLIWQPWPNSRFPLG